MCCGLLVRRELVGVGPEMTPLPAPLVFVANVPEVAFEEVQRRSDKVSEASQSSWDEVPGEFGGT